MLMPKRVKHRKQQRGRRTGAAAEALRVLAGELPGHPVQRSDRRIDVIGLIGQHAHEVVEPQQEIADLILPAAERRIELLDDIPDLAQSPAVHHDRQG